MKVQPGSLVIIIGEWPEFVGKIGEALEFCPKGSEHTLRGEPITMTRDCWGVQVRGVGIIDIRESCLLPIGGNNKSMSQNNIAIRGEA